MLDRRCNCPCHYGHNIMHCVPCCGPGSIEVDVDKDIEHVNPRINALGYKILLRKYETILVKVRYEIYP